MVSWSSPSHMTTGLGTSCSANKLLFFVSELYEDCVDGYCECMKNGLGSCISLGLKCSSDKDCPITHHCDTTTERCQCPGQGVLLGRHCLSGFWDSTYFSSRYFYVARLLPNIKHPTKYHNL